MSPVIVLMSLVARISSLSWASSGILRVIILEGFAFGLFNASPYFDSMCNNAGLRTPLPLFAFSPSSCI